MRLKILRVSAHLSHRKRVRLSLFAFTVLLFGSTLSCDKRFPAQRQGSALCDSLGSYVSTADAAIAEELWSLVLSAQSESLDTLTAKRARWHNFLREKRFTERIDRLLDEVRDPATRRRLWLARWWLINADLENDTSYSRAIDSLVTSSPVLSRETVSRYRINDSVNSHSHRMKSYQDRLSIDPHLADWTPRVVRLLNQKCQSVGYSSYLELELAEDSLDLTFVQSAISLLDSMSVQYYRDALDTLSALYGVEHPDGADVYYFSEHGPGNVQRILSRITRRKTLLAFLKVAGRLSVDLTSVGLYLDTSAATPSLRAPKVIVVNASQDIRVALGPLDTPVDLSYVTSFSMEMGRALTVLLSQNTDPLLRQFPGNLWESAVGMLIDELMFSQSSLRNVADVRDTEWSFFSRWMEMRRNIILRYSLLNAAFEVELYTNPNRDPLELYKTLFKKYLLVEPPNSYGSWNSLFWSHGIQSFRVNRLLGEAVAAQISSRGFRETGDIATSSEFGAFLRERCLQPGARRSWRELLKQATGEVLNLQYIMARYRPLAPDVTSD